MEKNKLKSYPPGTYGDISGYSPQKLTEKQLGIWRTGLSSANPAGAMLLVQEIDRLRTLLEEERLYTLMIRK